MLRILLAGLWCLLSAAAVPAQDKKYYCNECKGNGFLPCKGKDCNEKTNCGTKTPHKCDAQYGARCCRGTKKLLCPKCKDPVVDAELTAELSSRADWVESQRKLDDDVNARFSHIETEHWSFHWSVPEWKVGEVVLSRTRAGHLFAERLEKAYEMMADVFGTSTPRLTGYIVNTADEMMRCTLIKQGIGHANMPFKIYSPAGSFTCRPMAGGNGNDFDLKDDKFFHPHVVHTGVHIITQATYGCPRPMEFAPWIDEALSHWAEMQIVKQQTTFCMREVNNNKDRWRMADWKKEILGEVTSKKEEPFAKLITFQDDKLQPRDKAHCWSWVDFMLHGKNREKFPLFFKTLKETNDTKKALDAAYGWSTAAFHEKWREHVIKTYAP
ncbi:MAG TPA: hypothetical protein VEI02_17245 [Planctomycetota bacterium]|nr:hypothetical protein [Planctomycetota bacterium]